MPAPINEFVAIPEFLRQSFDWPAFLVPRKQARQSDLKPNLRGDALNARNRIAASLPRPLHPPRLRFACRFGSGRSVLPAIIPDYTHGDPEEIAFLPSLDGIVSRRQEPVCVGRRS